MSYSYYDRNPAYNPGLTPTPGVPGHFENEDYVFFWNGPFSNWRMADFTIATETDGLVKFNCSEQAMMFYKADLFQDDAIKKEIMEASTPGEQKKLGRVVRNFDATIWEANAIDLITRVLLAKFSQNEEFKKVLLATNQKTLVEASPFDAVWGIKMGVDHPDILDESKWKGKNLLGICLMNTRHLMVDMTAA